MHNIVVTQDLGLSRIDKSRLSKLGNVTYYDDLAESPEEWVERCQEADIICTGKFGLNTENLYNMHDKFFCIPFVGASFLDKERLKANNLLVSRAPGCNKKAVSEWIIAMILNLLREFPKYLNIKDLPREIPKEVKGLAGKKITILGKGNIGSRVGHICEALEMKVSYFRRNDNLIRSIREADVVVDTLSLNSETQGMLDKDFFNSFKKGAYFITVTSPKLYDLEAMIQALDSGVLAGVANDAGSIQVGDVKDKFYLRLANHPKIIATPHIAYNSDVTNHDGSRIMIENIEAYLKGNPINLV